MIIVWVIKMLKWFFCFWWGLLPNCCRFNTEVGDGRSRSFWCVAGTSLAPFDT
jgi:hypothetical protein